MAEPKAKESEQYDPSDHFDVAPFKMGRKTLYRKAMCDTNHVMLSKGNSINTICAKLGISKPTYYRWLQEKPDFQDSHEKGMAAGNSYWDVATHHHILGITSLTIDAAYIMKMRNVYGQMTKDPDSSKEDTKEFMRELAAIRSGGKVDQKEWDKQFSKKTNG